MPVHRNLRRVLPAALLLAAALPAAAQQDSALAQLQERIDELDQRVRVLDRLRELQAESLATAARTRVGVTAGPGGFSLRSADGAYQLRLRGYFQTDARVFFGDDAKVLTNDLLIRRVRPILEATVAKYYAFRVMPDFAGTATTLFDAYFEAQWKPSFGIRAGKFKTPIGLERLQSATDIKFLERGLPTNLVPTRDVGIQLQGSLGRGIAEYQAGIFNGAFDLGNNNADVSDRKELVGRLFLTPFARQGPRAPVDLGIGLAVSTTKEEGTSAATGLPGYREPGQQVVFRYRTSSANPVTGTVLADGTHSRVAPQAYLNKGPLGLIAEYVVSKQAVARDTGVSRTDEHLSHSAWQVTGGYFLTGEANSFRSITPKKNFDPLHGGWGALEVVARYGALTIDKDAFPRYADSTTSIRKENEWGLGVNWYFTRQVRVAVNYEVTTFKGGAATGDRPDEKFLGVRFQTAF